MTQKKCIINKALIFLLGVVVFYKISAGLIWALWHNLTWQCSNRENSMLFTAKKIPRTSKGTFKNPWTKRLRSPNSDMPTLHNWKALNIQTTAKQVCCTLSGRTARTANARGTTTAIFRSLFRLPKKSLPKWRHAKKYFSNFPTQKNPRMENFKPQDS